jgi:uncharacterized protein (TIGR02117 family)
MKNLIRLALKLMILFVSTTVLYIIIALLLSYIPANTKIGSATDKQIFLHSNGIHLDIIIPIENLNKSLKKDLIINQNDQYLSFGWGDEDFYLNTAQWKDLKLKTAINAMFLPSNTLMHVTRYTYKQTDWEAVDLTQKQLDKLNIIIDKSFSKDSSGAKRMIFNAAYGLNDNFYQAEGSYSIIKTCNTWVNSTFKSTGLKSSIWTPFDFGLMHYYQK